jgi:hypothetical protein
LCQKLCQTSKCAVITYGHAVGTSAAPGDWGRLHLERRSSRRHFDSGQQPTSPTAACSIGPSTSALVQVYLGTQRTDIQPVYVRTQIADSTGRAVRDRRLSLAKEFVNRGAGVAMEISGRAPVTAWWL